ncbi:unnamed protein product [Rotaria sordida]|uniref:Uncharacterized protein n=1 Tax=Rotaria sordida TaxID=392033 RepID=A0A814ZT51_9BILA|nr:unnamed protein product [Rotaria sordida]
MSTEINSTSSPSTSQQQITSVQQSDKHLIESLNSTIEKRSLMLIDQFEEYFRIAKYQLVQLNNTVTSM